MARWQPSTTLIILEGIGQQWHEFWGFSLVVITRWYLLCIPAFSLCVTRYRSSWIDQQTWTFQHRDFFCRVFKLIVLKEPLLRHAITSDVYNVTRSWRHKHCLMIVFQLQKNLLDLLWSRTTLTQLGLWLLNNNMYRLFRRQCFGIPTMIVQNKARPSLQFCQRIIQKEDISDEPSGTYNMKVQIYLANVLYQGDLWQHDTFLVTLDILRSYKCCRMISKRRMERERGRRQKAQKERAVRHTSGSSVQRHQYHSLSSYIVSCEDLNIECCCSQCAYYHLQDLVAQAQARPFLWIRRFTCSNTTSKIFTSSTWSVSKINSPVKSFVNLKGSWDR